MHSSSQLIENNIRIISGQILNSDELNRLWGRYYHSKRDENPAQQAAQKILDAETFDALEPETLTLILEVIALEKCALRSADSDFEATSVRLEDLETYIRQNYGDKLITRLDALPEYYQTLLSVIRSHTAQNKIRPLHALWTLAKDTLHHLGEEAQENPKSSLMLTGICGYIVYFMNKNLGASTIYIEPELTGVTDLSLEDLVGGSYDLTVDPALINYNAQPTCHDHWIQFFNQAGFGDQMSASLSQYLNEHAPALAMKHCQTVKDLLPRAQNALNSSYDWWVSRWDAVSGGPVRELADYFLKDGSAFKERFMIAAQNTADAAYGLNTLENIVLHSVMAISGFTISYKMTSMDNEEAKEMRQKVGDFFNRSVKNAPLAYAFSIASTATAYNLGDGMNYWMVWAALGGAVAGGALHRYLSKKNRHIHASKALLPAKNSLVAFNAPASTPIKTALPEVQMLSTPKGKAGKRLKLAGALIAVDLLINKGIISGYLSGFTAVFTMVLGANTVEDAAAHIGILSIAGVIGCTTGLSTKVVKKITAPLKPAFNSAGAMVRRPFEPLIAEVKSLKSLIISKTLTPLKEAFTRASRYIGQRISQGWSNGRTTLGDVEDRFYNTISNIGNELIRPIKKAVNSRYNRPSP